MKFRILPDFGWAALNFTDRLKLFAFMIQAGAGIAMTGFAAYAMYQLATYKAVWPVFYLGAIALVLVGIVITGLAGLLIKRSVEFEVGPVKLKAADAETAAAVGDAMKDLNNVQQPVQPVIQQDIPGDQHITTGPDDSARNEEGRDNTRPPEGQGGSDAGTR